VSCTADPSARKVPSEHEGLSASRVALCTSAIRRPVPLDHSLGPAEGEIDWAKVHPRPAAVGLRIALRSLQFTHQAIDRRLVRQDLPQLPCERQRLLPPARFAVERNQRVQHIQIARMPPIEGLQMLQRIVAPSGQLQRNCIDPGTSRAITTRAQSLTVGSTQPPQIHGKVQSAVSAAVAGRYLLQASGAIVACERQMTSNSPLSLTFPIIAGFDSM
jgi:hypothetical protein